MPEPNDGGTGGGGGEADARDGANRDVSTEQQGCLSQVANLDLIADDIFIMLDKSGSMNCPANDSMCEVPPAPVIYPTRWDAFAQAVSSFVNAPGSAGIGVGLGHFSAGSGCDVGAYAMPTVSIAPLPGNTSAIQNAIAGIMPGGNTPTVPALQGALQFARTYTENTPGRAASVVLVTDGYPNGCASTIAAAAMVAQQAYEGTPSTKTYVIGLGNTAALDQVALAGSGGARHYFPADGDVVTQLLAALTTISGVNTCNYALPATGDPLSVNVQVTIGGGMPAVIRYVGSAAMCALNGGWFFDNPTSPTKLILCPQTCDPIRTTTGSRVQVLVGCPRIGPGTN
jgi:hypothetical protein